MNLKNKVFKSMRNHSQDYLWNTIRRPMLNSALNGMTYRVWSHTEESLWRPEILHGMFSLNRAVGLKLHEYRFEKIQAETEGT